MLSMHDEAGWPVAVPVWFEWDGESVRCFSAADAPKVARLVRDPRASLLVPNRLDETERWVAFDGEVRVETEGGLELARRLAPRYWDLDVPRHRALLESWERAPGTLRLLVMRPRRIRSWQD
jgi:nitroimidazol reductase NimA-like FMN-containing flavoprotein (pyridoxamine 5'-phosphate oxidase superfamily)